jgi:hypothetical protein
MKSGSINPLKNIDSRSHEKRSADNIVDETIASCASVARHHPPLRQSTLPAMTFFNGASKMLIDLVPNRPKKTNTRGQGE